MNAVYNFIETRHLWGICWIAAFIAAVGAVVLLKCMLRYFFRRARLYFRLRKLNISTSGGFGWIFHRNRRGYDFYFEKNNILYGVCVYGWLWSGVDAAAGGENMLRVQHSILFPGPWGLISMPLGWKSKTLTTPRGEHNGRAVTAVLMFSPSPSTLSRSEKNIGDTLCPPALIGDYIYLDSAEISHM